MNLLAPARERDALVAAELLDEMEADASLVLDGLPVGSGTHAEELLDARVGPVLGPRTVVKPAVTAILLATGRLTRITSGGYRDRERYVARWPAPPEEREPEPTPEAALEPTPTPAPSRAPQPAEVTSAPEPMADTSAPTTAKDRGTCTLPPLGGEITQNALCIRLGGDKNHAHIKRILGAATWRFAKPGSPTAGKLYNLDAQLVGIIEGEGYTVEVEAAGLMQREPVTVGDVPREDDRLAYALPTDEDAVQASMLAEEPLRDVPPVDAGGDGQADDADLASLDAGDLTVCHVEVLPDATEDTAMIEREAPAIDEPRAPVDGDTLDDTEPVVSAETLADASELFDRLQREHLQRRTCAIEARDDLARLRRTLATLDSLLSLHCGPADELRPHVGQLQDLLDFATMDLDSAAQGLGEVLSTLR